MSAPKNEGSLRLCVDYREPNSLTVSKLICNSGDGQIYQFIRCHGIPFDFCRQQEILEDGYG